MRVKLYPIIGLALVSFALAQAQNVDVTAHVTIQPLQAAPPSSQRWPHLGR